MTTAAVLLIGDELLSGKIRDENGQYLAKMLRRRGIRLLEVAIVPDRTAAIGDALLRLGTAADLVFTSGGVGPTHDDITLAAIAEATGRPLARDPEMEAQLRQHYGAGITPEALRMADLPRGTTLRAAEGWPVLRLDLQAPATRVYILPGVPWLLRLKIEQLEGLPGELPQGEGWHLTTLTCDLDESRLSRPLQEVVAAHPEVDIGSYPRWTRTEDGRVVYRVRVTFEAPRARSARAEAARQALLARLPADVVVDPAE